MVSCAHLARSRWWLLVLRLPPGARERVGRPGGLIGNTCQPVGYRVDG